MEHLLDKPKRVLIVLQSLCAEGTPVLALEMCRLWQQQQIEVGFAILDSDPSDLSADLKKLNVPTFYLNIPGSGVGRYAVLLARTFALCLRFKPDAVLSMPLGWHAFIGYAARLAGVRRIAAHVGNYPPYWAGRLFKKFRLLVQMGRLASPVLVCCSRYVQEGVIRHFGVREEETRVIYNGCPVEKFVHTAEVRSEKGRSPFTIGMVARLEQHKDHPTLIRAARLLKDGGATPRVLLVGEGSRREEYEDLIRKLEVDDCVHILGVRRDIPDLLKQLDVFVFAVKPDEGFGVALVEAMASGVPVIATAVGACEEVLDGGKLGALVPPDDPDALAQALRHAAACPEKLKAAALLAREKSVNEFSIQRMAASYARCLALTV